MARTDFDPTTHLQLFRGSKLPPGVYAKHAGLACCGSAPYIIDRLADIVHGPNSLAHLKPTSFNDKYMLPFGPVGGTLENDRDNIISFMNHVGVGAKFGLIVIPNFAWVTDVSVRVEAEEDGVTFNLVTRNGLELPSDKVMKVETTRDADSPCALVRTQSEGSASDFEGIGALDSNVYVDIFGRDATGSFATEADEIMLEVASMPASGMVTGKFRIVVAVNYTIVDRAERE